ncbi:Alpha-glucosidase 2 (Alpha-glucosidase II) [Durusdinium trenchii]|uniref:Alpha-glucosidase 2 (Alpha-glucosidase II) n=1 Tax=Durusdinium trenchii TaxID=1381693 RepID=A0ABP0LCA5_9DINO
MAVCLGHLVILVLVLPGWGAQAPGSDLPDQLDRRQGHDKMEGSAAELVELVDLLQIADLKFQEKLLMCMNLNLYLRYVPAEVLAKPGSLGPVTGFAWKSPNGSELNITAGESLVSLTFVSPGTLRIRLAPSGEISDPTNGEIVTLSAESTSAKFVETSGGFEFSSGEVIVRGSRKPLMLSLYRAGSLVWKELRPMSFYGCGMQNGFYDHTGRFVLIHEGGGWDAGGRANPAPFFMSSRGYGALRNTYKPGAYNFSKQVMLAHDEAGLDSFYFIGNSMKDVLNLYTRVAGRPMLPPIWGLFLGDSDCYNNARHKGTTSSALLVAKNYSKNAMPRGWMLVNDGYGCGYTSRNMLQATQRGLGDVGIRIWELKRSSERVRLMGMGLWTSTGLANATWEIGHANSRVIKTDVAWVGHGYRFGLEAVKLAARLMMNSSNSRPYTWTVCGWAGTQKYAVIWTGDNTGSWEYIRMQIPTIIGSGLSGFAHATGDVDGIYGGSPETYVRDLQWKTFLTAAMTMSGWSKYDKQPWVFGEPYTTYNRKWLQLKASLTPYLYSLAFHAYLTGEPPARAMELEFPHEQWSDTSARQYQFMSGPFFLVAPVFRNETKRSVPILLPSGEWIDYSDGITRYQGPATLNAYNCPLDQLPVFVQAGAIVPMWPSLNFVGEKPVNELS